MACGTNGRSFPAEVIDHHSTNDDPPSKDDAFKAFLFTDLKCATASKLPKMVKDRCPIGLFG
jgi:hypothetical protein